MAYYNYNAGFARISACVLWAAANDAAGTSTANATATACTIAAEYRMGQRH